MELSFNNKTIAELGLPKTLYKYRRWDKASNKRILTNSEIYFAPPSSFKTGYECNLPRDYDSVTEEMLRDYCYRVARENYSGEMQIRAEARRLYQSNLFHDLENRKETQDYMKKIMNERLSIFCASEHSDNANLWKTFAGNHSGFCVGIDPVKMFSDAQLFGSGGKVEYYPTANPPKIPALTFGIEESAASAMKEIYSLPDVFIDEDEYRLTKMFIADRQVKINDEAITEIILGHNISFDDKHEITTIAKARLPHAKIYQEHYYPENGHYVSITEIEK